MTAFENLQELIHLLDSAPRVTELTVTGPGGAQITIKRPVSAAESVSSAFTQSAESSQAAQSNGFVGETAAYSDVPAQTEPPDPPTSPEALPTIVANRVGVFHPSKPSVERGDMVASGQIIGYIESMKLMNEVRSALAGTVIELLAEDDMPVEYGQPLLRLDQRVTV